MVQLRAVALSHRGRVRADNEDSVMLGGWLCRDPQGGLMQLAWQTDATALFLLADGMGGHAAGEVASRMAVESLLADLADAGSAVEIAAAIADADAAVRDAVRADPARAGMGTTIAGLLIADGLAFAFNVGDSRVYRAVSGYLRLLTQDDTREFLINGPDGARSGMLMQCLGGGGLDTPPDPHVQRLVLFGAERFLLCSDGLTDMLDHEALEACLEADPVRTAKQLFDAAMAAGGADNISIIIIDYLADRSPSATEKVR
jgi:serine/threonine protein phosphatase PrpC